MTIDALDADLVDDALWATAPGAVEERAAAGGRITFVAGYPSRMEADGAARSVSALLGDRNHILDVREVTDDGWLDRWRDHARPVHAGRFTVVPTWLGYDEAAAVASGTTVLRLDPGRAFGSGSHPTTVLMLRAVDALVVPGAAVLDVGCGSGVLTVAAAAIGASAVVAIDVDPAAVLATDANAVTNGVADRVTASRDPLGSIAGTFDVVLANLLAPIIGALSHSLAGHVRPGGRLVLSGLLAERWPLTARLFPGWSVSSVDREDGWVAVTLAPPQSHRSAEQQDADRYGADP